jgi:hypothetical protein
VSGGTLDRAGEDRRDAALFRGRIAALLGSAFNFLILNLVLLVASLPVVTVPIAVNAATVALERWRSEGNEAVIREFLTALRARSPLRTTLLVGVPLAVTAVGVEEVHYFLRGGDVVARVCFGLGLAGLFVALTALGYVFVLVARGPSVPATELWSLCIQLAVRNLLVTGPLFLVEIAGATVLVLADPPLILGVPIVLVYLVKLTAEFGLRRAERRAP